MPAFYPVKTYLKHFFAILQTGRIFHIIEALQRKTVIFMTVGERIKYYRKEAGLTQQEVADKLGVNAQAIHKYEKGIVTNIPIKNIEMMASMFGVSPETLTGWEDEPDHPRSPIDTYDDEILAELQRLHDDPDLRMLLSASHKLSKKDLQFMIDLARRMHSEE